MKFERLAGCMPHAMHAIWRQTVQPGQHCMQLTDTHQSCPMTKRAQNMVPCANQYAGHAHLQPQKGKLSSLIPALPRELEPLTPISFYMPEQPRLESASMPHHWSRALAPAARPRTMETSFTRWNTERAVSFSQQCLGTAFRMSASVNGGGADRSSFWGSCIAEQHLLWCPAEQAATVSHMHSSSTMGGNHNQLVTAR